MADTKISALPASTTPLAGTEVLPIVQSSATKQVSVANLTAGRAISATQLTLTTGSVIVASGQGVDFSATSSGSGTMTSELFADYEEGTWTPSVGGTATYTAQSGTYTKVGRTVTVVCSITINLILTGSTTLISGLPFATSILCSGSVGYYASLATNVIALTCSTGPGTPTQINFLSSAAAAATVTNLPAILGNSARVDCTLTYFV